MNLWVKRRDEPFEKARPLTADTRPVSASFWSRDSKQVLYVQDKGGDENFHVFAVDPSAGPDEKTGVPAARDLTPGDKLRAQVIAVPKGTPDEILVGLNDRDPTIHDVWRLTLSTGKKELLLQNTINAIGWVADLSGTVRLALKMNDLGGTEVWKVDGASFKNIYSCTAEESCGPLRFHKDNRRVYVETNKGEPDLTRLVLLDVDTLKEELVEEDPNHQVDLTGVEFSEKTDELIATLYEGDRLRVYPKESLFAADIQFVKKQLPQGDVLWASRSSDDRFQIVIATSDVDPGATYLYDRQAKKLDFLYRPRPRLPVEHLTAMKAVRIQARDGVEIQSYLSMPRGADQAKGLPAVILVHGGPWARDSWGYNSFAQFLANRGYVVIQPNFRGSSGFGKKFLNLGNGQWGTGTMQHDISDVREWLVREGIADPKRIAITGGSYGGYATLAGLTFTPNLYAAGVDIVGPSNILTLLHSLPPYWEPLRKMFALRVGDMDKPAELERLKAQSPLNSAKNIRAPLLVIQGANDPRVKQAEADQIVIALRELKLPVHYLVAPDEGHGFRGRVNRLAMMTEIEHFLGKHLGGRVQESIDDETAQKLAALRVDPAKVTLKTLNEAPAAAPVFGAVPLKPIELKYKMVAQVAGRSLEGVSTLSVKRAVKGQSWIVKTTDQTPMGESTDTTTLNGKTLWPSARNVKQGPILIDLSYQSQSLSGTIDIQGKKSPLSATADSAFIADGVPFFVALSTMNLAPGQRFAASSFDIQKSKTQRLTAVVAASESLQVDSQPVETWRVEIASSEEPNATASVWLEKGKARRVVKMTQALPQGAGLISYELTK